MQHHISVDMGDTYEMVKSICLMDAWKASYLGGDKIKLRNAKRASPRACVCTFIFDHCHIQLPAHLSFRIHHLAHIIRPEVNVSRTHYPSYNNDDNNNIHDQHANELSLIYNLCNLPLVPLMLFTTTDAHRSCGCCCLLHPTLSQYFRFQQIITMHVE